MNGCSIGVAVRVAIGHVAVLLVRLAVGVSVCFAVGLVAVGLVAVGVAVRRVHDTIRMAITCAIRVAVAVPVGFLRFQCLTSNKHNHKQQQSINRYVSNRNFTKA